MISPARPLPPVDFAAVRARRRAEAVKLMRRPGAVLDTSGMVPRVLLPAPGGSNAKEPPPPRPVASGIVRDLLDAGRLRPVPGEPGRYVLDVARRPSSPSSPSSSLSSSPLTGAEVAALWARVRATSVREVARAAGVDWHTLGGALGMDDARHAPEGRPATVRPATARRLRTYLATTQP